MEKVQYIHLLTIINKVYKMGIFSNIARTCRHHSALQFFGLNSRGRLPPITSGGESVLIQMPEDGEVGSLGEHNQRSVRKCPNKYAVLAGVVIGTVFFKAVMHMMLQQRFLDLYRDTLIIYWKIDDD